MSFSSPNLDDRDFHQLVEECKTIVRNSCPAWTDLTPSDPGMVLLELFAHLTEVMIYRLNRLPEKAFIEFLRLLGVKLTPPTSARATLRFSLNRSQSQAVEIPERTRVTMGKVMPQSEPPVFLTEAPGVLEPGQMEIEIGAYHCEAVDAEWLGLGTGSPGLCLQVKRPPIVASLPKSLDLRVGVEAAPGELDERMRAVSHLGKSYRIWTEVEDFVDLGAERFVYVVDRLAGSISFAPALLSRAEMDPSISAEPPSERPKALAAVPTAGREILAWYCRGGGSQGNVSAHSLTLAKDGLPGVSVTNPQPAVGGLAAESLENALIRGPLEIHSLHRAVTAKDFEMIARRETGAVARAMAFTKATLWKYASPGTVEVLLVPSIPSEARNRDRVTPDQLQEHQAASTLTHIQAALDLRRPLGTVCVVDWVRYKVVRVRARIVIHREEDRSQVAARVLRQLHRVISPLPSGDPGSTGWRFGQGLRAFQVYEIVLAEPGVKYIEHVRLLVDEAPSSQVTSIADDPFHPSAWYAASGETLFRTINDGDGWERLSAFPAQTVKFMRSHPVQPGVLVLVTEQAGEAPGYRIYVTRNCGEKWESIAHTTFSVDDAAWLFHRPAPTVVLATDAGLYELSLTAGSVPLKILVGPPDQLLGFYAVTVVDVRGIIHVAAAATSKRGVYLSDYENRPNTFKLIGLVGEDVRVLEAQRDGIRRFLWGGATATSSEVGKGCFRKEVPTSKDDWDRMDQGWKGGSCLALAFSESHVFAATHHAGALRIDSTQSVSAVRWVGPEVKSDLPMRDLERFQRVSTLAVSPAGKPLLVGGPEGIFRSEDGGTKYVGVSGREFVDEITLPGTWLFCSGEHELTILGEDEASRD